MVKRKHSSNSILRMVFVGLSLLFQIGWMILLILKLNEYSVWISLLTSILSVTVVLRLYSRQTTAAMKMPWIMLIMAFPVMGLSLYLLIVVFGDTGMTGKRIRRIGEKLEGVVDLSNYIPTEEDPTCANQHKYLLEHAKAPVYRNTDVRFYGEATDAFEALKTDLEKAEAFIFMEYFIVSDGSAFREIRQILERKVKQGVDVRLMYDDVGSIGYANFRFAKELNQAGIRCQVFNPALPFLNLFMNHRDHRKITVIDGKVGYTGGYNLSDEYFDRTRPYGKWKDTGLRLEGDAVRSLTATFLEMWLSSQREEENVVPFFGASHSLPDAAGNVQPYRDDPMSSERAAENVFLNMAGSAVDYLWFTTPYLIITDELNRALGLAAKRGVDVRIVTPGIPDKKMVYSVTRSYYAGLARQGVRLYEYSPGFCHAKQCVCDGKIASVGTSNLDYRSLYLHYENNVLFSGCEAVKQVETDFENLFEISREVTEQFRTGRKTILMLWQCILRLFAPMM